MSLKSKLVAMVLCLLVVAVAVVAEKLVRARKLPSCSITQMYNEMGHAATELDGVWLGLDGKQQQCKYVFFEHGPGRVVGGLNICVEGHFVVSISSPKGVINE